MDQAYGKQNECREITYQKLSQIQLRSVKSLRPHVGCFDFVYACKIDSLGHALILTKETTN